MAEIGVNVALFLISSGGATWLERVNAMFPHLDPKAAVWPAQLERLRRDMTLDPIYQRAVTESMGSAGRLEVGDTAGALIELAWLRQRHTRLVEAHDDRRLKFPDLAAAHLWVTRTALEQASHGVVAAHRARRFQSHCRRSLVRQMQHRFGTGRITSGRPAPRNRPDQPVLWRLADMGCGCGADTLAMAGAVARLDKAAIGKLAKVPDGVVLPEVRLSLTGLDTDPARLVFAAANCASAQHNVSVNLLDEYATERANAYLRQLGTPPAHSPQIVFEQADITSGQIEQRIDAAMYDAIFVDPGRRTASGERVFHIDAYQPPLGPLVDRWFAAQETGLRAGQLLGAGLGVKLSPGIAYSEIERFEPGALSELEFISQRGALKEAVLWFGDPIRTHTQSAPSLPVRVRATILPGDRHVPAVALTAALEPTDETDLDVTDAPQPGAYMLEPDPAIIRAHLVADLARRLNAQRLDPTIAYLVLLPPAIEKATNLVPFVRAFHIDTTIAPFSVKALRAALQGRGIERGQVVVKKRGSPITPQTLIQRLKLPLKVVQESDDDVTNTLTETPEGATIIILSRYADKPIAFITRAAQPVES